MATDSQPTNAAVPHRLTLTARQQAWRAKYGPWAVVTGASDGIGREMARCLARDGLNLVLVARRRAALDRVAAELSASTGVQTCVIAADLAQPGGVEAVLDATRDLEVGLLVASAGFGTSGRFIEADLANEINMLEVNCRALMALSHAFAGRFAAQRRGGLVLMSSLLGFQGVPLSAHYAATKAYVQSLAEGLYLELRPLGVDVLAAAPGPIHSGFAARANMQMGMALKPEQVARATLAALGRRATVRPGWLSKFIAGIIAPLPRLGRGRVFGIVMRGMVQH